ncbi:MULTISPECIES: Tim44 domain-containing protein [Desulfosediminicola]|uniref:Tim44 domain-containing protein n=1 Tax=Desulfosediminicola TaxID=2886823 RepID=UPI001E3A3687|nr:Tim44 domain-containing protein [Desulfosediminicola ganghwensis]
MVDTAEARSKIGGKSFRSAPKSAPVQQRTPAQNTQGQQSGSFGKGLAGGLLGGALGGMLFGSMFGMGGSGMGILPMLLLAGGGYFLYRRFKSSQQAGGAGYQQQGGGGLGGFPGSGQQGGAFGQTGGAGGMTDIPPPPPGSPMAVEAGLDEIRQSDRNFDAAHFKEVASDVFFQVQAGWMRRDVASYRHLLGEQLAGEYEQHFEEMKGNGIINKLESIAIRKIEIVDAGCTGTEDFITVLFTANLLDYKVDEKTGDVVEGSNSQPVKFAEEWTWARPINTEDWKLEGIKIADE